MGKIIAACIFFSAQFYGLPPTVLIGLYQAEGGKVGQEVANKNGSYDLGPMQINTIWLPQLAKSWGVSENTARRLVRDDACTNVRTAAEILRGHMDETGDITRAIAQYHSRTPRYGQPYQKKVLELMSYHGLIRSVDGR